MTALLTDNLPLLAGAPNGIKKLRELILELAVRGELVPQDPNDESANELVKRIAEEKALSENPKKTKSLAEITEDEKPFIAPSSWVLSRLGYVGEWAVGSGFPTQEQGLTDQPIPFCKVSDMNLPGNERFILTANNSIDETTASRLRVNVHPAGTVVFPKIGGAIATNKRRVLVKPTAIDNNCLGLTPNGTLSSDYLYLLLSSIDLTRYQAGTSVPALSQGVLADIIVGVPPLAEQQRIVDKVDKLMALCDRLEAQQAGADSAHAQLVQALLDSLTQASDADVFAQSWQRLAEHFHTLFTTESSIDALKQTLLQLAVIGKLVPQDPIDEPASELLKRIAEEKAKLLVEGKLKKQKSLTEITEAERPFEIPNYWSWSRIGELALNTEYGLSEKTSDLQDGVPVLKMGDIQSGQVLLGGQMKVSKATEGLPELYLEPGDLLYNRTNSAELVGKTGLFLGRSGEFTFASYLIRIRCLKSLFSPAYLNISMNAPGFRQSQINPHLKQQCGQANVNGTIMKNMMIPVPPVAEQHRIVAKVDQLMTLCDQLKARLANASQLNELLSATLVERALTKGDKNPDFVATNESARALLAAEITHRLHSHRTFGQRKLQKVIYLAEHAAKLRTIQGQYLRDAAGPHDRQLMNQVEHSLLERQWYKRIDRETVGYAYRPLPAAGQHRKEYETLWSAEERSDIQRVINLMQEWSTDRCEMTVTLYAAWNDLILEGRSANDDAILAEVMHSWNDTKLRFSKAEWLTVLAKMKQHQQLIPSGFGSPTTGGMLTFPGFE